MLKADVAAGVYRVTVDSGNVKVTLDIWQKKSELKFQEKPNSQTYSSKRVKVLFNFAHLDHDEGIDLYAGYGGEDGEGGVGGD